MNHPPSLWELSLFGLSTGKWTLCSQGQLDCQQLSVASVAVLFHCGQLVSEEHMGEVFGFGQMIPQEVLYVFLQWVVFQGRTVSKDDPWVEMSQRGC